MNAHVANLRTLVLNADMQPVGWAPFRWSWQDAFWSPLLKGRVYPVATYDDVLVRSADQSFEVPSVVALKAYHRRKTIAFTRYTFSCATNSPASIRAKGLGEGSHLDHLIRARRAASLCGPILSPAVSAIIC